MSDFGIYFGAEKVDITSVKKNNALRNISIPVVTSDVIKSEQKILDDKIMAQLLKEGLAKNEIFPDKASIALAGEDLIVRTFEVPIFMSKKELEYGAMAFEAKKYIPFKIEEMVFNYCLFPDRQNKKLLVLFAGIKKEILDKYLGICNQMQIQVGLVEYAGFSMLRLLKLSGIKSKGVFGLLNVDLEEETNFLVCQDGFLLFNRDINLISKSDFPGLEGETNFGKRDEVSFQKKITLMEKLKGEIRISLDFFRRKFPTKPIEKIVILTLPEFQTEIVSLIKDLGLLAVPLEISRFLGNDFKFSAALSKSFAVGISNAQRLRFSVDFLKPASKKKAAAGLQFEGLLSAMSTLRINPKVVMSALLIIILTVGWGWLKQLPLENGLKVIKANMPKIEGVFGNQSLAAITGLYEEYVNKLDFMENTVKNRVYLTEIMDVIPRLMPEGVWLRSLSFNVQQHKLEFNLEGVVFLANSDKEFATVNDLVLRLKNDPKVSRRFKEVNITSMERASLRQLNLEATKFRILCQ